MALVTVILTVTLQIPSARSLKDKRRILKSLFARLRNNFNISIAEVGDNDRPGAARLAAAVVSNETSYGHQVMSQVLNRIENEAELVMIDCSTEVY